MAFAHESITDRIWASEHWIMIWSAMADPVHRDERLTRDSVDPYDAVMLGRPVAGEEFPGVGRAGGRLGEPVGGTERVELRHYRHRVLLVPHRGVDAGEQQPARPGVRGQEDRAVGWGHLGVG